MPINISIKIGEEKIITFIKMKIFSIRPIRIISIDNILITYLVTAKCANLFYRTVHHSNHKLGKPSFGLYYHEARIEASPVRVLKLPSSHRRKMTFFKKFIYIFQDNHVAVEINKFGKISQSKEVNFVKGIAPVS
ncbi:MAG: hypothetical protein JWP93_534 [Polaromonas sp.]|nr:hypothetical protein [Polaromonas sp.]